MTLQGHCQEVTSVMWCPTDFTKVVILPPTHSYLCGRELLRFLCKRPFLLGCWCSLRSCDCRLCAHVQ